MATRKGRKKSSKTEPTAKSQNTNDDVIQNESFDKEVGKDEPLKKDSQRASWFLTINNPLPNFSHENIRAIAYDSKAFRNAPVYLCYANEIGENGTPHTHILLCFNYPMRFSTVQKAFQGKAHIDALRGSISQTVDYIAKRGTKWENDKKHDTQVDDNFEKTGQSSFHEFGEQPANTTGKKFDMAELYKMIENGYSDSEILELNKDWLFNINKIREARNVIQLGKENKKAKDGVLSDRKVQTFYYYGDVEKAIDYIYSMHSDTSIYLVTDYRHPFDNYSGEKVLVFSYYDRQFNLSELMLYCSSRTRSLPARYNNCVALFESVYIVSVESLESLYSLEQTNKRATWSQFRMNLGSIVYFDGAKIEYKYTGKTNTIALPNKPLFTAPNTAVSKEAVAFFDMKEI